MLEPKWILMSMMSNTVKTDLGMSEGYDFRQHTQFRQ